MKKKGKMDLGLNMDISKFYLRWTESIFTSNFDDRFDESRRLIRLARNDLSSCLNMNFPDFKTASSVWEHANELDIKILLDEDNVLDYADFIEGYKNDSAYFFNEKSEFLDSLYESPELFYCFKPSIKAFDDNFLVSELYILKSYVLAIEDEYDYYDEVQDQMINVKQRLIDYMESNPSDTVNPFLKAFHFFETLYYIDMAYDYYYENRLGHARNTLFDAQNLLKKYRDHHPKEKIKDLEGSILELKMRLNIDLSEEDGDNFNVVDGSSKFNRRE